MKWIIQQPIDLNHGYPEVVVFSDVLMVVGDNGAHEWRVPITQNNESIDLTGFTVKGHFKRADSSSVSVDGSVSDNIISVIFSTDCYAIAGTVRGIIQLTKDGKTLTVCEAFFTIRP